jgi:hypothetical protein
MCTISGTLGIPCAVNVWGIVWATNFDARIASVARFMCAEGLALADFASRKHSPRMGLIRPRLERTSGFRSGLPVKSPTTIFGNSMFKRINMMVLWRDRR